MIVYRKNSDLLRHDMTSLHAFAPVECGCRNRSLAVEARGICQLQQATASKILQAGGDLQLLKNGQKTIRSGFDSASGARYPLDCAKTVYNVPDRNGRCCALDAANLRRSDTSRRRNGALASGGFVLGAPGIGVSVVISLPGDIYPLLLDILLPLAGICSSSS
jgi:hypothetical protein